MLLMEIGNYETKAIEESFEYIIRKLGALSLKTAKSLGLKPKNDYYKHGGNFEATLDVQGGRIALQFTEMKDVAGKKWPMRLHIAFTQKPNMLSDLHDDDEELTNTFDVMHGQFVEWASTIMAAVSTKIAENVMFKTHASIGLDASNQESIDASELTKEFFMTKLKKSAFNMQFIIPYGEHKQWT